jgi:transcriptional regulator with XRE-family HTH domain
MLRLERGLSQFELAELVELSEEQISNIERGKSWTGELSFALLADALRVAQQSLFDYSQNDAFVKTGGLKRRAARKPAKLIVTRKRKFTVQIPKKKR